MWGFWLILMFMFLATATVPAYPYSRDWGFYPAGGAFAGLMLVSILIWFEYLIFIWPWASGVNR